MGKFRGFLHLKSCTSCVFQIFFLSKHLLFQTVSKSGNDIVFSILQSHQFSVRIRIAVRWSNYVHQTQATLTVGPDYKPEEISQILDQTLGKRSKGLPPKKNLGENGFPKRQNGTGLTKRKPLQWYPFLPFVQGSVGNYRYLGISSLADSPIRPYPMSKSISLCTALLQLFPENHSIKNEL